MYECYRGGYAPGGPGPGGPGGQEAAAPSRPPGDALPPALLAMIRSAVLAVHELCRHFWGCVPAGNAPAKQAKVCVGGRGSPGEVVVRWGCIHARR